LQQDKRDHLRSGVVKPARAGAGTVVSRTANSAAEHETSQRLLPAKPLQRGAA